MPLVCQLSESFLPQSCHGPQADCGGHSGAYRRVLSETDLNDFSTFTGTDRQPGQPLAMVPAVLSAASHLPAPRIAGRFAISWARDPGQVRAAQRLRHLVFAEELGQRLHTPLAGHDVDLFDDYCEHLLIADARSGELVATCRVLTPQQARRAGSTCCDTEFDLTRLRALREHMAELGRVCVRADQRDGFALYALWRALLSFLKHENLGCVLGQVALPQQGAASVWQQLQAGYMAPIEDQVRTRVPARQPVQDSQAIDAAPTALPAVLRSSLQWGARVLGKPSWNADSASISLPLLLRLRDLPAWMHCAAE